MYQPPHYREDRIDVQHALIRAHPLGLLISAGPGGLMANQVPFLVDADTDGRVDANADADASVNADANVKADANASANANGNANVSSLGTLRCHVSRANPQWRELTSIEECLVVFQGPQDYVTPSWYATKRETGKVVPTWNYATVHVWGRPRVIDDETWLRRQIHDLTQSRESTRAKPWGVDDAPPDYVTSQVKGIIGIEIPIVRIEGKWKMSQNRPEADRIGIVEGYREQGESSTAIANLVAERGGLVDAHQRADVLAPARARHELDRQSRRAT